MSKVLAPGSVLGVLGSGQLGRMFALAARELGYRVHVFSPEANSPTGQIADREFIAGYDDLAAIEEFARSVSVITFEFENVPAASTDVARRFTEVAPCVEILHLSQNRNREKSSLAKMGIPVPGFRPLHSLEDLQNAADELGLPAVFKTATMGYDGKGQQMLQPETNLAEVWSRFEGQEAILEEFVDFESELSVVAARGRNGDFEACGPILNTHTNHILDLSILPAGVDQAIGEQAVEITRQVMEEYEVVGNLCIEFFLTKSGDLLVNEIAPRPHNSGHLTTDACVTSQFEQQVRAICGLPLGSFASLKAAAMSNLLGDVWDKGEPDWSGVAALPNVKIHVYGKEEARAGRKMGHLTALAESTEEAAELARSAREILSRSSK